VQFGASRPAGGSCTTARSSVACSFIRDSRYGAQHTVAVFCSASGPGIETPEKLHATATDGVVYLYQMPLPETADVRHTPSVGTCTGMPSHVELEYKSMRPAHCAVTAHEQSEHESDVPVLTTCFTDSGPVGQATLPGAVMQAWYVAPHCDAHPPAQRAAFASAGAQTRPCAATLTFSGWAAPLDLHVPPIGGCAANL
jgi:hypothetical protein